MSRPPGRAWIRYSLPLLALMAVVAVGFRWVPRLARPDSPRAPALRIEDPSGVSLEAPEGVFLEGTRLSIRLQNDGPDPSPWQRRGAAVCVEGSTPQRAAGKSSVVLPGQAGETVLFESVGRWYPLPTRPAKLPGGGSGLEVTLDSLPLPWKLMVAAGVNPSSVEPASPADRLEILRASDRKAFLQELEALEKPRASLFFSPAQAAESSATAELEAARIAFARADAMITGEGREKLRRASAVKLYRDGLEHLALARQKLLELPRSQRQEKLADDLIGGNWKLEELVEQYCGTFAPWGLELTLGITLQPDIHQRGFDIRVLPHFGELAFINLTLRDGPQALALNRKTGEPILKVLELKHYQMAKEMRLDPKQALTLEMVRLYSPRLYDLTTSEVISQAKTGVSYISAFMALAIIVDPPAALPFLGAFFEAIAPLVDEMLVKPEAKRMHREHGLNPFYVFVYADTGKLLLAQALNPAADPTLNRTELLLNLMIDYEELDTLEKTRPLNGGAEGYKDRSGWFTESRFAVPPVILHTQVFGPSSLRQQSPFGSYPLGAWGRARYRFNYDAVSHTRLNPYNLSKALERQHSELRLKPQEGLSFATTYGHHWVPVADEGWSHTVLDEAPDLQVLEFELEKKLVEAWAQSHQLKPDELLKKASLQLCLGDTWQDGASYRVAPPLSRERAVELGRLRRSQRGYRFSVALGPKTFLPGRNRVFPDNMEAGELGEWSQLELMHYDQPASLRFTAQIVMGKETLLTFPVGFGTAATGTSTTTSLLETTRSVEVVSMKPDAAPKQDIMDFLLPADRLPGGLVEQKRERLEDASVGVEIAAQEVVREGTHQDVRNAHLFPEPDFESAAEERAYRQEIARDYEVDSAGRPLRPKPLPPGQARVYLDVRVVRAYEPSGSQTLLKAFSSAKEVKPQGEGYWESPTTAAKYRFIFQDGDLFVGVAGSNNKPDTVSLAKQLRPLLLKRLKEVRRK